MFVDGGSLCGWGTASASSCRQQRGWASGKPGLQLPKGWQLLLAGCFVQFMLFCLGWLVLVDILTSLEQHGLL